MSCCGRAPAAAVDRSSFVIVDEQRAAPGPRGRGGWSRARDTPSCVRILEERKTPRRRGRCRSNNMRDLQHTHTPITHPRWCGWCVARRRARGHHCRRALRGDAVVVASGRRRRRRWLGADAVSGARMVSFRSIRTPSTATRSASCRRGRRLLGLVFCARLACGAFAMGCGETNRCSFERIRAPSPALCVASVVAS